MRSRPLVVCCLAALLWGCAKRDEPPPPGPQAPPAAPRQAEPTDEDERPSEVAEEPATGADLPNTTAKPAPTPQGGLERSEAKEQPAFADLASAQRAFKAADLELVQLFGRSASALSDGDARCDRACQAFSSLERAADGICRLAGESDQRCSKARSRVKEHAVRLKACECS